MTGLLQAMSRTPVAEPYFDALPILGVDGSLATVGRDPPNPLIEPAIGKVYAKTGTTVEPGRLKAQVFAGYMDAKSGKRLAYVVYVNNVAPIESIADVINGLRRRRRDLGAALRAVLSCVSGSPA